VEESEHGLFEIPNIRIPQGFGWTEKLTNSNV